MTGVQIKTPDVSQNIKTYLASDYSSGTDLDVASSISFASGNYVIVGEPGLENTEITNLTAAPSDNTSLTVSALKFSHPKGTPVYYINWDKYSLEYRTSSAGTWTVYGSMPTDVAYDAQYAEYRDTSSTTSYEWRYRYYSSESSAYSDYSDTIGVSGWARNSVGYMIREIRKIINDNDEKTISDTEIIRFLNAAQDKIYSLYNRWWFLFTIGTAIDTVADQKEYDLPSDFGRMHHLSFNYVSGSNDITYNLRYLPMNEFEYEARDNNASDSDDVKYYTIFPTEFYIWPKPETAGLHLTPFYYKTFTDLTTYASETEVPIPDILENYALCQILKIRKEEDKAGIYEGMFKEQIGLLKLMQIKNVGSMRTLWKYKGVDPERRFFGNRDVYSDAEREANW